MRRTGVWALCGAAILLGLDGVGGVLEQIGAVVPLGIAVVLLVLAVGVAGVGVWLYRSLIMRRWARREATELAGPRAVLPGLGVGVVFIGLSFGIVVALGGDRVGPAASFGIGDLVDVATLVVVSAVLEELLFRGVILLAIERWIGRWPALAITSLLFGVAHLANPGATLFSAVAIALEAGFFLGALFLWRRSLWFTIGVHAAWNATESLLGIPVSGQTAHGLVAVTAVGAPLLTGGAFGLEASVVPVVVGAVLGIGALLLARRFPVRA